MELYGFMEREKKIPSYFFIITKFTKEQLFDEEVWLSGYKSLAKFLNCSVPTVCRIVKSGKIDSATKKVGGTYWFNKALISSLISAK